jgi:hypothetical protein
MIECNGNFPDGRPAATNSDSRISRLSGTTASARRFPINEKLKTECQVSSCGFEELTVALLKPLLRRPCLRSVR